MLRINICLVLVISLITFHEETRVQATKNCPLRKLLRRKEVEDRRREEEERKRKEEEEENIEYLRRKVFHEYLLNQITGQSTVLKDFYNRF